MLKAILLFLAIGLIYWLLVGKKMKARPTARQAGPENMVVCAYCQLRVPESEAVATPGHYYCCDEHRRRDAA